MIRVGLICDFSEERWPSMDHCGNMLATSLRQKADASIEVQRLEPAFRRIATRLPWIGSLDVARNYDRLWNRMVEYPSWLRRRNSDFSLFHIVDHSYSHLALALPAQRTIVTCHDLDTFRSIIPPNKEPRSIWFRAMTKRILQGFQVAHHVIFVSHTVRDEALRLGLVDSARSSVIYNGANDVALVDIEADAAVTAMLGPPSDSPLLLHVGSTAPRKRIDVLLRVLAEITVSRLDIRLIRVGPPLTDAQRSLAKQLQVDRFMVHLPFVDRAILAALYRRATLLLLPSDAEGFGLPIVEAMAAGCPAVVSDLPVLREIGSTAAIYCQRENISAWVSTVLQTLECKNSDPARWTALQDSSVQNAQRFSWKENATQVTAVYRQAMEAGTRVS